MMTAAAAPYAGKKKHFNRPVSGLTLQLVRRISFSAMNNAGITKGVRLPIARSSNVRPRRSADRAPALPLVPCIQRMPEPVRIIRFGARLIFSATSLTGHFVGEKFALKRCRCCAMQLFNVRHRFYALASGALKITGFFGDGLPRFQ